MYYHIINIKMASNNELKEIIIKNCACYNFVSIVNINDIDLDNILLVGKSYKNF